MDAPVLGRIRLRVRDLLTLAPVAQRIELPVSTRRVGGSSPSGRAMPLSFIGRIGGSQPSEQSSSLCRGTIRVVHDGNASIQEVMITTGGTLILYAPVG